MEEEIGRITHYFPKISVGVVELGRGGLAVGDTIHISGHTTELYQKVQSMQIEHATVREVREGMQVGLKVEGPVRVNDRVYKLVE